MEKYNIGQMMILREDLETKGMLSDNKIRKKGTKLFVKADPKHPEVTYLNGDIQMLPKDSEIVGYSTVGISEWIYTWLKNRYELKDFLSDYDIEEKEFKEVIEDALEELGMYDNTGNRS